MNWTPFKRIEANLRARFECEDFQEEKILASNFLIVWIVFEGLEDMPSYQEIVKLLSNTDFGEGNADYLDEYDRTEDIGGSGYIKLVFRKDDEKEYEDYLNQTGCEGDYEEELNQERWF
tara:strand:+ start:311 stop:667 length:357 start_codon:yes stop_codon:yes gene_type:complete